MKQVVGIIVTILLGTFLGASDHLEDLVLEGRTINTSYLKALQDTQKAKDEIPGLPLFESSSIKIDSSLAQGPQGLALGISANIALPILDQVSLSGKLSQDSSGQLGISINPLYHGTGSTMATLNYQRALLNQGKSSLETDQAARRALVTYWVAQESLGLLQRSVDMAERTYQLAKDELALGVKTLEEVRQALKNWTEGQNNLIKGLQDFNSSKTNLRQWYSTQTIESLTQDYGLSLDGAISKLRSLIEGSNLGSQIVSVLLAELDLETAQVQYQGIWAFDPSLTISAGTNFNQVQGIQAPQISLGLTIGATSFKAQEKAYSLENLHFAQGALELAKLSAASLLQESMGNLEVAKQNLELQVLSQVASKEVYLETLALYERGRASDLELAGAQLSLDQGILEVNKAKGQLWLAYGELLAFIP